MSFTGASTLQETQINDVTNRATTLEGRAQAIENTAVLQRSDFATHVAAKNVKDTEQDDRLTILENATSTANTDFESYVSANDTKNVEQDDRLVAVETKAETSKQSFESYVTSNDSTVTSLSATVTANKTAYDTYIESNDTRNVAQDSRLDSVESRLDEIDTNIVGRVDDAINSKVATTTFDLLASELRDVDSDLSTALATKVASTVQVQTDAAQDAKIDTRLLQTDYNAYTTEDIKINKLNEIKLTAMEQFIRAFLSTYTITNSLDQVYTYKGYAQKEFEIAPATLSFVSRLNDNTRINIKSLEYATRSNANQIRIYNASQFELLSTTLATESKTVSTSLGDITQIYTMTRAVTAGDFPIKLTYQDTNGNVICEQSLTYVQYQALPNNDVRLIKSTGVTYNNTTSKVSIVYATTQDAAAITNVEYAIDDSDGWGSLITGVTTAVGNTIEFSVTERPVQIRFITKVGTDIQEDKVAQVIREFSSAELIDPSSIDYSGAQISLNYPTADITQGIVSISYFYFNGITWSGLINVKTQDITISGTSAKFAFTDNAIAEMRTIVKFGHTYSEKDSVNGIPVIQVPSAPTNLVATTGDSQVSISYTPGSDNGAAITNYKYSIDNGVTWIAFSPAVTGSPVTITGLTNETTYSIKLRAVNSVGDGAASSSVSVTPIAPTTWIQMGADIDGEAIGDKSGFSVSTSADGLTVAIGAYFNNGNGTDFGHVRVYTWNSTTSVWVQRGTDIDGEAVDDYSGASVSLSADGSVVAIGARTNDGNGSSSGHVRVYTWNSTTSAWIQRGADIDGEAASDWSGWSVSLSADGSVVAIGAINNNGNGTAADNRGHVRVYTWNSTTSAWIQRGADIDGEAAGDQSGYSVSLSADGSVVAIGAHLNNATDSGHVRVYTWNSTTSTWVQRGADINGEATGDRSGFSVSLSADGSVVAIGAINNDGNGTAADNRGHVRVYTWNSTTSAWVQRGADIDGEAAGDQSGLSVSLSADGSVVAIGAYLNDGNTGTATDNRGHIRVYTWNSTTSAWVKRGVDIDGEAANDQSGYSVSLSADGSVVAIGAINNDGTTGTTTDNRGHVRVYRFQ